MTLSANQARLWLDDWATTPRGVARLWLDDEPVSGGAPPPPPTVRVAAPSTPTATNPFSVTFGSQDLRGRRRTLADATLLRDDEEFAALGL